MFDSRDRSVDPRFGVNDPRSNGRRTEPAKSFRFAITWTSLTAHLELREAAELTSAAAAESLQGAKQSSLAVLADVAGPPLVQRPETQSDSSARWEMVVPKMVRTDRVSQALTQAAPFADHHNSDVYTPISIPTFASFGSPSLLSRALAMVGWRTPSLIAGPDKPIDTIPFWSRLDSARFALANGRASRSQILQLNAPSSPVLIDNQTAQNENTKERHAVRELLLSKITSTLRRRGRGTDSTFAINHQEEQWSKAPNKDEPESPYSYDQR